MCLVVGEGGTGFILLLKLKLNIVIFNLILEENNSNNVLVSFNLVKTASEVIVGTPSFCGQI